VNARALCLLLGLVLLLLCGLSLLVGRSGLMWSSGGTGSELWRLIVWELRLPRTLLALCCGAGLGLAGAVLQGYTRNPLAEPGLLGSSSGAALGAVLAIYTGMGLLWPMFVPLAGMAGAALATALTLVLGGGGGVMVLVLAGAAVAALLLAGVALVLNLAPNPYAAYEITQWMMGSLSDRGWDALLLAAPFTIAGLVVLAFSARALNALSLGEQQALSLGVNLQALRLRVLVGTALAVGATTAVTGAIGFIGLVAPHLMRHTTGHEPGRLLWPAALCGAVLLLAADVLARALPFDQELKLGVLTALAGAPFFLRLVWRMKKVAP
jgi:iron complex transport system permease protein